MRKFAEKTITYIQVPLKSLEQIILFLFFFPQTTEEFFLASICAAIVEQISDLALFTHIGVKEKEIGLLCELILL